VCVSANSAWVRRKTGIYFFKRVFVFFERAYVTVVVGANRKPLRCAVDVVRMWLIQEAAASPATTKASQGSCHPMLLHFQSEKDGDQV
jgi:hypothetical protein